MSENYDLWKTQLPKHDDFNRFTTQAKLTYFCLLAHLGPSSHNTQPWRFFINETNKIITVYLDRKFVLPASDVSGRQALVSLGCAIENMMCGATYFGWRPTLKYLDVNKNTVKPFLETEQQRTAIAEISFTEASPAPHLEKIVKAIFERKIVRAEYDPERPISEETLEIIKKISDENATKLHVITDGLRRLSIAEFQAQADGFVINSPKFSRELGAWLLPNDTENFVGMPGNGFGLPDDQALRLHNGLLGIAPLRPDDGLKFALAGKTGLEKCPMIGIITTEQDDISNWISAGRTFEKIFLTLTSENIQVAMHAGITEVPLIKKIASITLGTTRHLTVLFRAGYVRREEDKNRAHSPRLPLTEVILTEKP